MAEAEAELARVDERLGEGADAAPSTVHVRWLPLRTWLQPVHSHKVLLMLLAGVCSAVPPRLHANPKTHDGSRKVLTEG